jgi:hypothetical protein
MKHDPGIERWYVMASIVFFLFEGTVAHPKMFREKTFTRASASRQPQHGKL